MVGEGAREGYPSPRVASLRARANTHCSPAGGSRGRGLARGLSLCPQPGGLTGRPQEGTTFWSKVYYINLLKVPSSALGVSQGPRGKEALPAECVRVCACTSVCVWQARAAVGRACSVHCMGRVGVGGRRGPFPVSLAGGGSSLRGSVLHIHTVGRADGSRSPHRTALLSQTSQHHNLSWALERATGHPTPPALASRQPEAALR